MQEWKRGRGFQKLDASCGCLLREIFQTKEFLYSKIAQDWQGIVGLEISSVTRPQRIQVFKNEGTLCLDVDISGSLWIPAHSSVIIERVNQYIGYKAVNRIIFRKTEIQSASKFSSKAVQQQEKTVCRAHLETFIHQQHPDLLSIPDTKLAAALTDLACEILKLESEKITLQ